MSARVIAIANQKGGVGKTLTAVTLTGYLQERGARVLLIDMDPQGSATAAFNVRPDNITLYTVMSQARDRAPRLFLEAAVHWLDKGARLIPADIELARLEVALIQVYRREEILRDLLISERAEYDVILIDCPPTLGWLTTNALTAADAVLVPVVPDYLSTRGLGGLHDSIESVQTHLNPSLQVLGVLLTRVQRVNEHKGGRENIAAAAALWGWPILPIEIPNSIRAASSVSEGVPLTQLDPTNPAALAYSALGDYLFSEVSSHATP